MRRLELDFALESSASRWAGSVLCVLGIAFAADLGLSYVSLLKELAQEEARLIKFSGGSRDARLVRVSVKLPSAENYAEARETVRRLSVPWDRLFRALEWAQLDAVALDAIEPDSDTGMVLISGEAQHYLAMLSYVATLRSESSLTEVHLLRHDTRAAGAQRPVLFTVSARWMARR